MAPPPPTAPNGVRFATCLAVACALLAPLPSNAATALRADDGTPLRWVPGSPHFVAGIYLPLAGNPLNRGSVDPDVFRRSVVRALQRWQAASGGALGFDYWQGADFDDYPPALEWDGLSTIHFAVASGIADLPPGVAGLTRVWWDLDTKQIVEVDIVLNDAQFEFTDDPLITDAVTGNNTGILLLEDVITHELGHALGLDHSAALGATLFPKPWAGQASLSCDDQTGVREVLAQGSSAGDFGTLSGYVLSPAGEPVFGAVVKVISVDEGAVVASVLTEASGRYRASNLVPGEHFLLVEPLYSGAEALGSWYAGVDHEVCFGDRWSRRFVHGTDGRSLERFHVEPGEITAVAPVRVRCEGGRADIPPPFGGVTLEDAPPVRAESAARFAFIDEPELGQRRYYDLGSFSGDLRVDLLSYSLFSPVFLDARLFDSTGEQVASTSEPILDNSDEGGLVLWDLRLEADGLPLDRYLLDVRAQRLALSLYPEDDQYVDLAGFVLVSGQLDAAATGAPACREEPVFPPYTNPLGSPARYDPTDHGAPRGCSAVGERAGHRPSGAAWLLFLAVAAGPVRRGRERSEG